MAEADLKTRLDALDWARLGRSLDAHGHALTPTLLGDAEADALIGLYGDDARFRSTIDMERHRFGRGQYRYFARPLPDLVQELRTQVYARLVPIANRWKQQLGRERRYPATLDAFLQDCHAKEQTRPTPLLLHYVEDDYNCLHQDLYGDVAFPLQVAIFLSRPELDYGGGEFLLLEQRPRAQSRGEAIRAERGQMLIFPNAERPTAGKRGVVRTVMRHGVSRITRGERYTLGVIFHDAR